MTLSRLVFLGIFALFGCVGREDAIAPADASAPAPDARKIPKPGDPCVDRRDCDDGVFCNGVEECLGSFCTSARNAACRDLGGCAVATCEESKGACSFEPSGKCESGSACLVELGCTKVEGCTSEKDPRCDDGRACTDDRCDVASGRCLHVPIDARCPASGACGIGACLGDRVAEASGCGLLPDASRCALDEGCIDDACVKLAATCSRDEQCTNGSLCDGLERCVDGRCVHGTRTRCIARDGCHHVECRPRTLGDPYCVETPIPSLGCPSGA